MKLLCYGRVVRKNPSLVDGDGNLRDLSSVFADITPEILAPRRLARLAAPPPSFPVSFRTETVYCIAAFSAHVGIG